MAKYSKLDEPVFINKVKEINSKHGGMVYEVEFIGIKTKKAYKSYIDPSNNNFGHWRMILEVAENKGVVLSGMKYKDEDKAILNADSSAKTEYIVTKDELAEVLEEYWDSQNKFKKLFE